MDGDLLERRDWLETLGSSVQVVMDSWVGKAVGAAITLYLGAGFLLKGYNIAVAAIQGARQGFQLRAAAGGTFELVET